ncbi:MAG: DUF5673 domain-containing protein [Firmicutes bacterium]|nr:DUF5673 domain-containing protein [Bacillota bacterium]
MPTFLLPLIIIPICAIVMMSCSMFAYRLIKRQRKLNRSITLVKLKNRKVHFFIFLGVIAGMTIYVFIQMLFATGSEVSILTRIFAASRTVVNISLGALIFALLSVAFLLVVLIYYKSAVVDKGIYTSSGYLEWYHVHDYIIDEEKGIVILTSNKETFSTIAGTTTPLKVSKDDISKLKYILGKNKNKFSAINY